MSKVLMVRIGGMGDILQALPVAAGIRAALPDATIGWMVAARWRELLKAEGPSESPQLSEQKPLVNYLHIVKKRASGGKMHPAVLAEAAGEIRRIRAVGYEVALDFGGSWSEALVTALSGIKRRAGFDEPADPSARRFYTEKYRRNGEHVVSWNLALAAEALAKHLPKDEVKALTPQLPRDPAAEAWAEAEKKRLGVRQFVLMTPGAGWGAKRWPAERYGEVAKSLAGKDLSTLVNVGPGEEPLAEAAVRSSGGAAVAVRCSVGQLIALTRTAELAIAGDTGPLHLAAALQRPVVALFAQSPPEIAGPFGTRSVVLRHPESKSSAVHDEKPDPGLMKIAVEEVVEAVKKLLDGG